MKFKSYSKLHSIYTESPPNTPKMILGKFLFYFVLWIIILYSVFYVFNVSSDTFISFYLGIYVVLELLLLFVFITLYESTTSIISFSKTVPIKENQLFFFHFILSGFTWEFGLEIAIIIIFLLTIDTPVSNILLLLFLSTCIKFFRTYFEFFIVWMKTRELKLPYWSFIFLIVAFIAYISFSDLLSLRAQMEVSLSIQLILSLITIFLFISLGTYKFILRSLLRDNQSNFNFPKFNNYTASLSHIFSLVFKANKHFQTLIKITFTKLFRDVDYLSAILRMNTTVLVFLIISKSFFSSSSIGQDTDILFDILYIGFIINFLNISNVKMDYNFNEKNRMDFLPLSLKTERKAWDIVNSFFLFMNFNFLLWLYTIVEGAPLNHILTGYIAFFTFLMLGLLLESFYIYKVTKKTKIALFISFLVVGLTIEVLFLSSLNYIGQLALGGVLFIVTCLVRYQFSDFKKRKKVTSSNNSIMVKN
ncbi:hypothetical protein [Halobacillus sp. A5]|uniref:hypothetical protein n=1 Tax=Halobacillus sp. A5 TaxID=2880263 RepID=UPI0020A66322|nr:hypothetical protein [Halobacillus sp. A5]MCP3029625.1 hypothetical protein [Halobacillus sp. A5]